MRASNKLGLDRTRIRRCRALAQTIVNALLPDITSRSTDSIERAVLRFWGIEGQLKGGIPIVNAVVERLHQAGRLTGGAAVPVAALVTQTGGTVSQVCYELALGKLAWPAEQECFQSATRETITQLSQQAMRELEQALAQREANRAALGESAPPWLYVIVATGNIHEDVKQARSAVASGADCIAVIRSTAQSLLDYVPEGATTEGFGGTYATGENFAIMRAALDEAGSKAGRYIRLVNYASGLCMPEISMLAAQRRLDMLLNDSMYGIIFRDIHRLRTFVDQHVSRRICAAAGIIINTGEDNYLTTANAVEAAHTVLASQFINERFARAAGMPPSLMGLGHAFEVDPKLENSLLYELATALLTREIFPDAPIKYMPPTRHKTGDIFFSHLLDGMFNLASVTTGQTIHLCGMPTEALHTPFVQDRYLALEAAKYARTAARGLRAEMSFRPGGFIVQRAAQVLQEAEQLLERIAASGLMQALAEGIFADIRRPAEAGRGGEGVFLKGPEYCDAFEEAGI
jgi:beta-lysine 5,6-aminomutase alpha subunit